MTAHRTDLPVVDRAEEAGSFDVVGQEVVDRRALSRRGCVVVVVADVAGLVEEGRTGLMRAGWARESGMTACRTIVGCEVVDNRLLTESGTSWVVHARCRYRSGPRSSTHNFAAPAGYASLQTCPPRRR